MRNLVLSLLLSLVSLPLLAGRVEGIVSDLNNEPLPFSSILVKGTTIGTTANQQGRYVLTLGEGAYTIVCQRIGYQTLEKRITVSASDIELNFKLEVQQYKLNDVTVKAGAEDPAYGIIRKTIAKRSEHEKELKQFQCEVYIKGQLKLRDHPTKFLGRKVDFEDGDTSKKKMLFLSESVSRFSYQEPDFKIEVLSTRVSGQTGGYGLGVPQFLSFYNNNIQVGQGLNPRGFISPISDNALNYYRYKFEGTFYEDGVEISRIKVIPKRKYEPLFSGHINIIEDQWRIHSTRLLLLQEQQMQLLDSLMIEQIYMPEKASGKWLLKQQVMYPAIKIFSFDAHGSFLQVYDKFNLDPAFPKGFFDQTVLKYADSSNKKPLVYWDTTRPIALQQEEVEDYRKKDSLEVVRQNPDYLDSLDRKNNKLKVTDLVLWGHSIANSKKKRYISIDALLEMISYNTVEGGVIQASPTYRQEYEGRKSWSITPVLRYGLVNEHFNPSASFRYNFATKRASSIEVAGGSKVFQFNNNSALTQRVNTFSTLIWNENLLKIYEAEFGKVQYSQALPAGFNISVQLQYQHRKPLENTSFTSWRKQNNQPFTPNYPVEITNTNIPKHKAFMAGIGIRWRPGSKYLEFPDRVVSLGSRYPLFNLSLTTGIPGVMGSDIDYSRWRLSISDNLNFKIGGSFRYRIGTGGFLHQKKLYVPDYTHFNGNVGLVASEYLNSFQLASLYQLSNSEKNYQFGHVEYHLNGLLSNKIPGFRKLNWFFVVGGNGLRIDNKSWHYEMFFSIENILKVIRVDFVKGFQPGGVQLDGIRISLPGMLTGGND